MAVLKLGSIPISSEVNCVAISPDQSVLAIGGPEHKTKFFSMNEASEDNCKLLSWVSTGSGVNALSWSRRTYEIGNVHIHLVAVGTAEGLLHILARRQGGSTIQYVIEISGRLHSMDIKDLQWMEDYIITGGVDNHLCLVAITLDEDSKMLKLDVPKRVSLHSG